MPWHQTFRGNPQVHLRLSPQHGNRSSRNGDEIIEVQR